MTHREVPMLRDEVEKVTRPRRSVMSYSTETEGVTLSTKQSWAGDTWGSSGAPMTTGLLCTSCEVGVPPAKDCSSMPEKGFPSQGGGEWAEVKHILSQCSIKVYDKF